MKGYSLIEIIIVVAIISVLALVGSIRFNQFREDTNVNLVTDEFVSQIKTARVKSMAGEINEGEIYSDFEESGLPSFGVKVSGNSYSLFREYIAKGDSDATRENFETTTLGSAFSISGDSEILFPRIKAVSSGNFVIEKDGIAKSEIIINSQGIITVNKL